MFDVPSEQNRFEVASILIIQLYPFKCLFWKIYLFLWGLYIDTVDSFFVLHSKDLNFKVSRLKNEDHFFDSTETTTVCCLKLEQVAVLHTIQTVYFWRTNSALESTWHDLCTVVIFLTRIAVQVWLQVISGELLVCVWPNVAFPLLNDLGSLPVSLARCKCSMNGKAFWSQNGLCRHSVKIIGCTVT